MTLVIWVFCLFKSMKILFLFICVIQALFINAQSLIGLIDRDNSLSITNAEGQGVSIIGLSWGPGINKTSVMQLITIHLDGMNHPYLQPL